MFKRLKALFLFDRRREEQPVIVERRKPRLTHADADKRLCESIERFNQTIVRKREDLLR